MKAWLLQVAKRRTSMDPSLVEKMKLVIADVPKQKDGCSCGVFVCAYAEHLSPGAPFTFSQADIPKLRRLLAYQIITGKLL